MPSESLLASYYFFLLGVIIVPKFLLQTFDFTYSTCASETDYPRNCAKKVLATQALDQTAAA